MSTTPLPPRVPGSEWGTFTSPHFQQELARRNMGPFTPSNLDTSGLNAELRARTLELEAKARLEAKGVISPSAQAASGKGGVGPRTATPNPAQPITAPRPTVRTPGVRPGVGIGGQVGLGLGAQVLYPIADRVAGDAGRAVGGVIGDVTGIKDSPQEFDSKPGWYKRWHCFNAATAGVNDPRCEEAPPPVSPSEVAGSEVIYDEPPFTGGQMSTLYAIDWNYSYGEGTFPGSFYFLEGPVSLSTAPESADSNEGCLPGRPFKRFTMIGAKIGITLASGCGASISGLRVTRADGLPDTGGDLQGAPITPPAERPQRTAPPPPSSPFNPEPLPQPAPATPAPPPAIPAPAPELEPTNPAPNRPPDRRAAPVPVTIPEPPIAPDGSPTGNPAPDATPENVPAEKYGTTTLPSGTTVTRTPTGYTISAPVTSPRPIETPDGGTIAPGETIEEEKKAGGLPWWMAAPPVVAKIPTGAKVNATDPSTFTNPDPPTTPPPSQPPTDNPCRCNAPINNRLDKLDEKLTKALGGVSVAGDSGILAYLVKMQTFAEKAWQATRLQKVVNALTLLTVVHNASMISRDVGETLGYAISQGLDVLGVEDEKGQALDVNNWFGKQTTKFFEGIFGVERWRGLNATWNKANRIISSASNIVNTIRSVSDGVKEVTEMAAENTGKIGNALKRSGLVTERSYPWMAEKVRAQDAWSRKTARIMDGLESAENIAGSFAQVTGNVKEIQDEMTELKEQTTAFQTLVGAPPETTKVATPAENAAIVTAGDEGATNAKSGPAVTATDMEPGTNGTP